MNITRVEFIVTFACTGRCKHCSVGEKEDKSEHIEYARMAGMLTRLKSAYPIESVMCFGGEPLLYPDEVCSIFEEAQAAGIPMRQLITNGFFSRNPEEIAATAEKPNQCATQILLSVDAFHQETIPLEPVQIFAKHAKYLKLHPAWLVSPEDGNPWNMRTREVLTQFGDLPVSNGNIIFPRGNALKYLTEYFLGEIPQESPYDHLPCLSILPNGNVSFDQEIIGNAYRDDILKLMR